jgi:hypothetical protein
VVQVLLHSGAWGETGDRGEDPAEGVVRFTVAVQVQGLHGACGDGQRDQSDDVVPCAARAEVGHQRIQRGVGAEEVGWDCVGSAVLAEI